MFNKHFFKTVILFTGMIILGLIGIFLVSQFGKSEDRSTVGAPTCENKEVC